ncbi:MAG: hypothetical protein J0I09_02675 [Sphingobacteriia bacterium]|nr:hypothetical protein [Sphingobacteriia bacterium]
MKTAIGLFALVVSIIGCGTSNSADETMAFIPGTYVREGQHEFGKEHDTLIITLQNETAKEYKIERRFLYERVLDGKPVEPEYKQKETSGTYNPDSKLITETQTGKTFSFDAKKGMLFSGPNQFIKIKN